MCFERLLQAFARWQPGILFDIAAQPILEYRWIDSYSQPSLRTQFKVATIESHTYHPLSTSIPIIPYLNFHTLIYKPQITTRHHLRCLNAILSRNRLSRYIVLIGWSRIQNRLDEGFSQGRKLKIWKFAYETWNSAFCAYRVWLRPKTASISWPTRRVQLTLLPRTESRTPSINNCVCIHTYP